jgi:NADH-quinone oxidoreductase subunit M
MGTYGFLRFALPLFPEATRYFTPLFSWLAIIGILYGALVSMVQPDLKKLVAYSSVSHLGFVMLGIFALTIQGMEGGILQMVNHGLSTGALFLIVGMIYERRHTRMIEDFGGLARVIPVFTAFFLIVTLSSIGLPGLNGFVGEFLILLGTFRVHRLYAVLATAGVVLAAVYMLWMFQRVMFGSVTHDENRRLRDLTAREIAVLLPVLLVIVWIGVYPRPFLAVTEASVKQLLAQVHVGYRVDDKGADSAPLRAAERGSREWSAERLAPRSGQWTIDDGRSSASVASHEGTESREPRAGMPAQGQGHPQGTRGAGEALIADRTGARHAE